ncbi:HNH endonuclease [Streptococcus salivarius]|uniref:HNH endonuclease n=1 Tax=Streptococcus salivarius TaxID=1304 RepID=UPI00319E7ED4
MSLLLRFKNEKKSGEGTIENHLAICRRYGKVLWGQYYNNTKNKNKYISDDKFQWLKNSDDKRIIFLNSENHHIYVGILEEIYRREDNNLPIEDISKYVPKYYREELYEGKESRVGAWFVVSDLNRVYDPDYLENIYLAFSQNKKDSIIKSLNSQSNRFYVINANDGEITKEEVEFKEWESRAETKYGYIPSTEDKKLRRRRNAVVREGQQKFRKTVLDFFNGRCCISNSDIDVVLEAAHITPFNGKTSNIIENGICLRTDIHRLWDSYLISINPETFKVEISSLLNDTEYKQFEGKEVFKSLDRDSIPQKFTLGVHYTEFKSSN